MINPSSRRCVRCHTRGHFADDEEDFHTERVASLNQMSHFCPRAGAVVLGNDHQARKLSLLHKFSLLVPKKIYREQRGEYGY